MENCQSFESRRDSNRRRCQAGSSIERATVLARSTAQSKTTLSILFFGSSTRCLCYSTSLVFGSFVLLYADQVSVVGERMASSGRPRLLRRWAQRKLENDQVHPPFYSECPSCFLRGSLLGPLAIVPEVPARSSWNLLSPLARAETSPKLCPSHYSVGKGLALTIVLLSSPLLRHAHVRYSLVTSSSSPSFRDSVSNS